MTFVVASSGVAVKVVDSIVLGRVPLIIREEFSTVPVAPPVQRAIERATEAAYDALCCALAPFGLTPLDIAVPQFEQVIYHDEVPIYLALVRERAEKEKL